MLQDEPPIDRLHVSQPTLGVDADPYAGETDDGIPGSQVTLTGDRHFRSLGREAGDDAPKSVQHVQLALVPKPATNGIRPSRQIEADGAEELCHDDERDVGMSTALDRRDPCFRKADRAPDSRLCNARSEPRLSELIEQVMKEPLATPSSTLSW